MAGSFQSLILVALVSVGGVFLRLMSIFGPTWIAWALTFTVGVGAFVAGSILLGLGIAVAMLGLL